MCEKDICDPQRQVAIAPAVPSSCAGVSATKKLKISMVVMEEGGRYLKDKYQSVIPARRPQDKYSGIQPEYHTQPRSSLPGDTSTHKDGP